MNTLDSGICFHCGSENPPGTKVETIEGRELHFCCHGCREVFLFINSAGFSSYYKHRAALSRRPEDSATDAAVWQVRENKIPLRSDGLRELTVFIEGIQCASCVWLNRKILESIPGVTDVRISLSSHRAKLLYDPARSDLYSIAKACASAGYKIRLTSEQPVRESSRLLKKMVVAGFLAGNMMLISFSLYSGYFGSMDFLTRRFFHFASWLLATPALFYCASVFLRTAWNGFKRRMLVPDMLTSAGFLLAYFHSVWVTLRGEGEVFFDAITFVSFVLLTGRFLETRMRERYLREMHDHATSLPDTVRLAGKREIRALELLKRGEIFSVRPGETVPADGFLVSEAALIDEAIVSGESEPVLRRPGERILAGAQCAGGEILIRAEFDGISSRIRGWQEKNGNPDDNLPLPVVISFNRIFVLLVAVLAVACFSLWKIRGADTVFALSCAITLLIVACPCALNLSIPAGFARLWQQAEKKGILISSLRAARNFRNAGTIVFDKTGTLTAGRPELTSFSSPGSRISREKAIRLCASLELKSGEAHPVAAEFIRLYRGRAAAVSGFCNLPGLGVTGKIGKTGYLLGSARLMEQYGIVVPEDGNHNIFLATETGRLLACFRMEDTIRPEAAFVIRELSARHQIIMLTGDRNAAAMKIAGQAGIRFVHSEKLPEEKREIIAALKKAGGVIMIGDGLNDTGALKEADAGITFLRSMDITGRNSDILLRGNDLAALPHLEWLTRKAASVIRGNLIFSVAYNLILLPLALSGVLIPLVGAIAMSGSSLLVLLNAFRIRLAREKTAEKPLISAGSGLRSTTVL